MDDPKPVQSTATNDIFEEKANDPWALAAKEGKELITPMDSKTIKNAIRKRIPHVAKIYLVRDSREMTKMQIVVVAQKPLGAVILIEDNANVFMRHKDLMNIVDDMWREYQKQKKGQGKQLPSNFFRSNDVQSFQQCV